MDSICGVFMEMLTMGNKISNFNIHRRILVPTPNSNNYFFALSEVTSHFEQLNEKPIIKHLWQTVFVLIAMDDNSTSDKVNVWLHKCNIVSPILCLHCPNMLCYREERFTGPEWVCFGYGLTFQQWQLSLHAKAHLYVLCRWSKISELCCRESKKLGVFMHILHLLTRS